MRKGACAEEARAESPLSSLPAVKTCYLPKMSSPLKSIKEFKIQEWCVDVAQLIECLLTMNETLGLIPSTELARRGSMYPSSQHTGSGGRKVTSLKSFTPA